jgi:hypothetical protein
VGLERERHGKHHRADQREVDGILRPRRILGGEAQVLVVQEPEVHRRQRVGAVSSLPGTYRAHTITTGIAILITGIAMAGIGIGLRIAPDGALAFSWLCVAGGGAYLLYAIFALGVAAGRRDAPKCPHCSGEVEVRVENMTGRLSLTKPGSK